MYKCIYSHDNDSVFLLNFIFKACEFVERQIIPEPIPLLSSNRF